MDSLEKCKTPHAKASPSTNYASRSGSINKTLLTPCRRVGLARKSPCCNNITNHLQPNIMNAKGEDSDSILTSPEIVNRMVGKLEDNFETPKRKLVETESTSPAVIKKRFPRDLKTVKVLVRKLDDQEIPKVPASSDMEPLECIPKHDDNLETELTRLGEDMHVTEAGLEALRQRVKEKEKLVQELRVKQVYQKKHNLDELSELTDLWRVGCQEALRQMLGTLIERGHSLTMPVLLTQLGIPQSLVQYDLDEEDFQ